MKETKPVLRYDSAEGKFHERSTDWVAAAPEVGFLFPAFDDRAANIYNALFYSKDTAQLHQESSTRCSAFRRPPCPPRSSRTCSPPP